MTYLSDLMGVADEIGLRGHPRVQRRAQQAPPKVVRRTLTGVLSPDRVSQLLASAPTGPTLSSGEVASWWGVDRRSIRRWAQDDLIPVASVTVGGHHRFDRDLLLGWLAREVGAGHSR